MDADGKQVSSYAIQSSGRPYEIKVIEGDTTVGKDGVAQVAIQVVDENGVPVRNNFV